MFPLELSDASSWKALKYAFIKLEKFHAFIQKMTSMTWCSSLNNNLRDNICNIRTFINATIWDDQMYLQIVMYVYSLHGRSRQSDAPTKAEGEGEREDIPKKATVIPT